MSILPVLADVTFLFLKDWLVRMWLGLGLLKHARVLMRILWLAELLIGNCIMKPGALSLCEIFATWAKFARFLSKRFRSCLSWLLCSTSKGLCWLTDSKPSSLWRHLLIWVTKFTCWPFTTRCAKFAICFVHWFREFLILWLRWHLTLLVSVWLLWGSRIK
jgi:hypothetical protein